MSEQLSFDACGLCGVTGAEVHRRLVEWLEPVDGRTWSNIPRCDDRAACRARIELEQGGQWEVNDRTPAPVRPTPAEPVSPIDAPAPDVEEEIAWLR